MLLCRNLKSTSTLHSQKSMAVCSTETKANDKEPKAKHKLAHDSKKDDADQGQYNSNIMDLTLSRLQV